MKYLIAVILLIWDKILDKINKSKKNPFSQSQYPIAYAFTHNCEAYYTFTDAIRMPTLRAIMAQTVQKQLAMGLSAKDMEMFIIEALECFDRQPLPIGRVRDILKLIQERGRMQIEPDSVLRLACIFYFTVNENIEYISEMEIEEKMAKLRSDKSLRAFFLNLPLAELSKSANLDKTTLLNYMTISLDVMEKQLKSINEGTSQSALLSLRIQELQLLRQNLQEE